MNFIKSFKEKEFLIIYSFLFLAFTWRIFLPDESRGNGIFFQDDFYYYLKIAENFWIKGFFTFDGINITNGFQPLWQFILLVPSLFFSGENLIKISLFINLFLIIYFFYIFKKILDENNLPFIPLVFLVISITFFPTLGQYIFNGMETALLAVFVILSIRTFNLLISNKTSRSHIYFGIFTGLAMLSRLDSFVFFILPYSYLLIINRKYFCISSLSHLMVTIPYLVWLYISSGSIIPISGEVKNFYSTFNYLFPNPTFQDYFYYLDDIYLNSISFLKYSSFFATPYILKFINFHFYVSLFISLISFIFFLIPFYFISKKTSMKFSVQIILILSIIFYAIFQVLYYNIFLIGLDNWTYGLSGLFILYFTFLIFALNNFDILFRKYISGMKISLVIIFAALLQIFPIFSYQNSTQDHISFGGENNNLYVKASEWANENLPKNSIVGAWAAGQLGFHLNHHTIQLEGLVNSNNFLNILKKEAFVQYTCDQKIKYLFLNAEFRNISVEEFMPAQLFRERSQIRTYRGKFLNAMWPHLELIWNSNPSFSKQNNATNSFFIWRINENFCENL